MSSECWGRRARRCCDEKEELMSVTRTTVEETMRRLEAGDWEALG
jgi:hypothetical protein